MITEALEGKGVCTKWATEIAANFAMVAAEWTPEDGDLIAYAAAMLWRRRVYKELGENTRGPLPNVADVELARAMVEAVTVPSKG